VVTEKSIGECLSRLTDTELQFALEPLLSMRLEQQTSVDSVNSVEAVLHSQQPIVLGRKVQTRLDLRLMLGDIGETRGRAIMLGFFKDVRPFDQGLAERRGLWTCDWMECWPR